MPIYEYKCSKCGEDFEAFQKITDLPLTDCKFCGGKVEQLISHSSFHLKGSGWYLTDYAKKSISPASTDSDSSKTTKAADTTGDKASTAPAKAEKTEKSTT